METKQTIETEQEDTERKETAQSKQSEGVPRSAPIDPSDDIAKKRSFIIKYQKLIRLYCAIIGTVVVVLTFIMDYDGTDRKNINDTTEQNPIVVNMGEVIDEARQLEREGKTKEAIREWQAIAVVARGNDNDLATRAYFAVGNLHRLEGSINEAIDAYENGLTLNDNFAEVYINLGKALNALGEHQKALTVCNEAIALKPDFVKVHLAEAYFVRGNALKGLRYYTAAINDYTRTLTQEPDHAEAYNKLGNAYYHKGDFNTAIENYNSAINLNPDLANAYYNLGIARLCLREWEKAKTDLTDAKTRGINLAASFHNDYEGVADFEAKHRVEVPEDLAGLLRRD